MQESPEDRSYHVVITAQGSATHWQARVGYYWYLKVGSSSLCKQYCVVWVSVQGLSHQQTEQVLRATFWHTVPCS